MLRGWRAELGASGAERKARRTEFFSRSTAPFARNSELFARRFERCSPPLQPVTPCHFTGYRLLPGSAAGATRMAETAHCLYWGAGVAVGLGVRAKYFPSTLTTAWLPTAPRLAPCWALA